MKQNEILTALGITVIIGIPLGIARFFIQERPQLRKRERDILIKTNDGKDMAALLDFVKLVETGAIG